MAAESLRFASSSSTAYATVSDGLSVLARVWAGIVAFFEETGAANVRATREQPFGL